ncbi:MAG: hypothetical protein ACKOPS_21145 [Cyanobium sp.]
MAFVPAPLSTETPAVELLMDVASGLEEISSRLTARAFTAVGHPEQGPALREVMAQLFAVLDATAREPGC